MPLIVASMRNWLQGGDLEGGRVDNTDAGRMVTALDGVRDGDGKVLDEAAALETGKKRVVVVHCKAGKGRSGTASCSYLIAEEGWTIDDALKRFTERRMRPSFGQGVSIPSQLRWIRYVDRWAKNGKKYRDGPIEILEVHVWGLRNGVKIDVEAFIDDGKKIEVFHTFKTEERTVVEAGAPDSSFSDAVWEMAGYPSRDSSRNSSVAEGQPQRSDTIMMPSQESTSESLRRHGTNLVEKVSPPGAHTKVDKLKSKTLGDITVPASTSASASASTSQDIDEKEPGGKQVILRPTKPILIPNCDVNLSVERRNKSPKSIGLTMVSAVAHVWFNTFFEGGGPEKAGKPDPSGVFGIDWDAMDGIKGSSRKGTRALDRVAIVWRALDGGDATTVTATTDPASIDTSNLPSGPASSTNPSVAVAQNVFQQQEGQQEQQQQQTTQPQTLAQVEVVEPNPGEPIPQVKPADWKGQDNEGKHKERDLGLRAMSPDSTEVSRASSVVSESLIGRVVERGREIEMEEGERVSTEAVKSSGPGGEELGLRSEDVREEKK